MLSIGLSEGADIVSDEPEQVEVTVGIAQGDVSNPKLHGEVVSNRYRAVIGQTFDISETLLTGHDTESAGGGSGRGSDAGRASGDSPIVAPVQADSPKAAAYQIAGGEPSAIEEQWG